MDKDIDNNDFGLVTDGDLFITNEVTDAFDKQLKTIGQGAFHEEASLSMKEILKKIVTDGEGKGKLTLDISFVKKLDDEIVQIEGVIKVSMDAKKYTSSSFVTRNYLPSRNREGK